MRKIWRIESALKKEIRDVLGERIKKRITEELGFLVWEMRVSKIYSIEMNLKKKEIEFLAREIFFDSVLEEFKINGFLKRDYEISIEIGFKPGVKDNEGDRAKEAIEEVLKRKIEGKVYTSKRYLIKGNLNKEKAQKIAKKILANPLIERWLILKKGEKEKFLEIPKIKISHLPQIKEIDLNVSDDKLLEISKKRSLALNLKEMKEIGAYFEKLGRNPTDAEIEIIAQTWSEHCKHKIFNSKISYKEGKTFQINSLFETFIKRATKRIKRKKKWLVSLFWDNSGVIELNKEWLFCFKCETHNSPSNEEPYGGALTGILGVYRDIMGTGRGGGLLYGTYGFCVGSPFYQGELLPKFHPKTLLEGVRKGVEDGGNKSGVPTVYGRVFFDMGYIGKPAIFVLAGGVIPKKIKGKLGHKKEIKPGHLIVMAGGRVGIDGIHGATQSSLEAGEWISASHVQLGDPFTQKKLHDFLIEARDRGLFSAITDNGAGGLSCSVGEMAKFSNGAEIWLERVPLKYSGLSPWQILLSESQERMTLAVSPQKIEELSQLAKKHEVEISVIGKFNRSGRFRVTYKGKLVADLDLDFLHQGVPQMTLKAQWKTPEERGLKEPILKKIRNHNLFLRKMLERPNIASKEYIVRQFDHEVQGKTVIKPLVGENLDVFSDAVVIKPLYHSNEGLAISAGINPKYSLIDTYWMTGYCIDEAIRRIIAIGGCLRQIVFNDNFCWPNPLPSKDNPDAEYKLAQLVRANKALYDFTLAFGTPCISGKDSMFMDGWVKTKKGKLKRISALPTLQISAVGKIKDIRRCVTMDVKKSGDLLYILGPTKDELGTSEYYEARKKIGLNVPKLEPKLAKKLYNALEKAIEKGLVNSCHGIYRGGLAVALAEISFGGGFGLEVYLEKVPVKGKLKEVEKILYSESPSRFLVTISPENKRKFEKILKGNIFSQIGKVVNEKRLKVFFKKRSIINEDIFRLKKSWQRTFKDF